MQIQYSGTDIGIISLHDIGRRSSMNIYSRHVAQDQYIHAGDTLTLVDTSHVLTSAAKGMLKKYADAGVFVLVP